MGDEMSDRELIGMLACPNCRGEVTQAADGNGIICAKCRLRYPVKEGIPVMLITEAEKIG